MRLSPTSINTYFRSPRLFYYQYVLKMSSPPNIHLYKGNFVHKILEDLFQNHKYVPPKEYCLTRLKEWNPPEAIVSHMSDDEKKIDHTQEMTKMMENFSLHFDNKVDMVVLEGKAKDKNHAWNLIRPIFSEHRITDSERNVVGVIDSVERSFDEQVYLIDYKTSKLYRHTLPEDYIRQVSVYAYLFKQEFGRLPNYAGIHYLRYGEIYLIPITEDIVKRAIADIEYVQEHSKSTNIEDYPKGNDQFANKECEYYEQKLSII